jgi:hypothetical protein
MKDKTTPIKASKKAEEVKETVPALVAPAEFELSTLKLCLKLLELNFSADPEHLRAIENVQKLIATKTSA